MRLGRLVGIAAALVACSIALAGILMASAEPVAALPALPYVAYGAGLKAGQVVEALLDSTAVGRVTADRAGRWKISIEPGPTAEGDRITFSVDGVPSGKSIVFASGQFPAPPGIQLGAAPAPTVTSTPAPRPAPRPAATPSAVPRATPRAVPGCVRNGRPVICATPVPIRPVAR